jgi:hypothetical protein
VRIASYALELAGIAVLVYGIYLFSLPLACIVGGLAAILLAQTFGGER